MWGQRLPEARHVQDIEYQHFQVFPQLPLTLRIAAGFNARQDIATKIANQFRVNELRIHYFGELSLIDISSMQGVLATCVFNAVIRVQLAKLVHEPLFFVPIALSWFGSAINELFTRQHFARQSRVIYHHQFTLTEANHAHGSILFT